MKGRSHRVASAAEPDDWVDGSWTVDCTCGVTFDDGEEMVSCDDCGVWVHTRCSRFVRGQTSFTCDNCKSKSNSSRKESEEKEVAQLLLELPTKTMRMDFFPARRPFRLWTDLPIAERVHVQGVPGGDPALFRGLSSVFTPQLWKCTGYVPKKFNFQYREFPCWDEKADAEPMPAFGALISGNPEKEKKKNQKEDDEEPANIGADVLFSLKEARPKPDKCSAPAVEDDWKEEHESDEDESDDEDDNDQDEAAPLIPETEMKKRDGKALNTKSLSNHSKAILENVKNEKARSSLQALHVSKRKTEEVSQDQVTRKKAKSSHKDGGNKNKAGSGETLHQFNGFTLSRQASKIGAGEDTSVTFTDGNMQALEEVANKETRRMERNFDEYKKDEEHCGKPEPDVCFSTDSTVQIFSQKRENLEDANDHGFSASGVSTVASSGKPMAEAKTTMEVLVKVEDDADQNANLNLASAVPSVEPQLPPCYQNLTVNVSVGIDGPVARQKDAVNSPGSARPINKNKVVAEDGQFAHKTASSSIVNNDNDFTDPKLISQMPDGPSNSLIQESLSPAMKFTAKQVAQQGGPSNKVASMEHENLQEHDAVSRASPNARSFNDVEKIDLPTCGNEKLAKNGAFRSSDHEACNNDLEELGVASTVQDGFSKSKHELGGLHPSQNGSLKSRQELLGYSLQDCQDGSSKSALGVKYVSGSKSSNTKSSTLSDNRNRLIAGNNKVPVSGVTTKCGPGTSGNDFISSATESGHKRSVASVTASLAKTHSTKLPERSSLSIGTPPASSIGKFEGENSQEMTSSSGKDRLKISLRSGSKVAHSRTVVSPSSSKHGSFSRQKEESVPLPLKASPSHSTAISSGAGNPSVSSQDVSSVLKRPPLDSSSKVQIHNECSQSSTKVAKSQPRIHGPVPVNATSALSDGELALLLHQELNSSPRVPRVPRMRQAGGGSQVVPQTTFSTLSKRSSVNAAQVSGGVKGHNLVPRRKNKDDISRESSRGIVDEARKAKRKPPDQILQEESEAGSNVRKDVGEKSSENFGFTKKMTSLTASAVGNSQQSSSAEASNQMVTSTHKATGKISDEDAIAHAGASTHTLPGLIDDILSKNKDMSYEELCNAVLPHWHNLRKHNGERYAYSSHSHAVLDCLRNRNSWAQLVDRGPKTNSSRKRRKLEDDAANVDSDTGDDTDTSKPKDEEGGGTADPLQEDVPKRKRRARNGRRLAMQGRSFRKKGKRRLKTVISDDEEEDDELEDDDAFSASSDGADKIYSDDESEGAGLGTLRSKVPSSDESESEQ